jgi:long-chain acyl-CoA synthetase
VPDTYRGQSPKAFLKGHLGKHEMVQELEIRAELPKTPIGKLSKKDLIADEQRKLAEARAAG